MKPRRLAAARLLFIALPALLLLTACPPETQFLERQIVVVGQTYHYRVWLPPHYTELRRWPVILFLHGSGERGDDNLRQLTMGLPALVARNPNRFPAIVVAPQCPLNREWYGEVETAVLAELDHAIAEFHGDRNRVILTGISMGGAGAWYMARNPQRWAAVVPVCGEVVRDLDDPWPVDPPPDVAAILQSTDPFATLATRIGGVPVWAFHGADDEVIPVDQSRMMVNALKNAGGNVRYTEYPETGHDAWDRAYDEPELALWMMTQRKSSSRPAAAPPTPPGS